MQNTTHTNTAIDAASVTPETSRMMRENMRAMIRNLVSEFMNEQKAYVVKLADFKKWCRQNYGSGNTLVTLAQQYYKDAGFTGRGQGPWYGGPYGFWEYDRLERWCSKMVDISVYKKDNRIMIQAGRKIGDNHVVVFLNA